MGRPTPEERDRILDLLGRRDGYPDPDYGKVARNAGIARATLRKWVYRDRKRNGTSPERGTERKERDRVAQPCTTLDTATFEDLRVPEKQLPAFFAMLEGKTVTEAAEAAGVSVWTVWRWRQEPGWRAAFQDYLRQFAERGMEHLIIMRDQAGEALLLQLRDAEGMDTSDLRMIFFAACDRTGLPKTEHQHITQGISEAVQDELELARRIVSVYPQAVVLLRAAGEWDEEESMSIIDVEPA